MQIRTDAREVQDDLGADLAQMVGRTNARDQQQLRRPDGTGGQDHLLPRRGHRISTGRGVFDTRGDAVVDDDSTHDGIGDDV
jgi:hypothetical protein